MKKLLLLFFAILMFGTADYNSNTNEKNAASQKGKQTSDHSGSNGVNQSNNVTDNKTQFLAKLDAMKIQDNYSDTGAIDSNIKIWDDALTEIYGVLKTQLSQPEMHDLRATQRQWFIDRDAAAQERYDEAGGVSLSSVVYDETLVKVTNERCYELVNLYM